MKRRVVAVGAVSLSALFSITLFLVARQWESASLKSDLQMIAEDRFGAIQTLLMNDWEVLYSIRSFFRASHRVEPDEFARFVKEPLSRHPEIETVHWPHDFADATDSNRREAMARALKTDIPIAMISQDPGKLLVYLSLRTAKDRPSSFSLLEAGLNLPVLVSAAVKNLNLGGVDLYLYDVTSSHDPKLLVTHGSRMRTEGLLPVDPGEVYRGGKSLEWRASFKIFGRPSLMVVRPTGAFLAARRMWGSWAVLIGGSLFTIVLGLYFSRIVKRAEEIERHSEELTREVEERRRVVEALRKSEERFRIVARATNEILWDWDLKTNAIWWNEGIEKLFGYSKDAIGPDVTWWSENLHPEDQERILMEIHALLDSGGTFWSGEYRYRRADHSYAFIYDRGYVVHDYEGKPVRMIGSMMDITARKMAEEALRRSQEQLFHAQKLEAMGRLAAGVAHDFNNLLTAISGYSELVLKKMPENDPSRRNLGEVLKAADQAAKLTRQLLTFSRKQEFQPKEINLNGVVSEVAPMLQRLISQQIEIVTNLTPDLGSVKVDPNQIHQVLMNLAVNARDAMPKGGRLTVETGNSDAHVMLSVTDTGFGMDEATRSKIFEPFFTTKEEGKGTGLGLSIVYGIVQQNSGSISVQSEPGKGTTFKICFPRLNAVKKR